MGWAPTLTRAWSGGIKWATGDGHIMAANVGAQLIQMGGVDTLHIAAVHPKNTASANPFQVVPYSAGDQPAGAAVCR